MNPGRLLVAAVALSLIIYGGAQAQTLSEALNSQLIWTSGGDASWETTTEITRDGLGARSGPLALGQESWIETTVTGPTALVFWWRTDSYPSSSPLIFSGTGVQISGFDSVWERYSFYVPSGNQKVRWTFRQKAITSTREQRTYLDAVALADPEPVIITISPTNQIVLAGDSVSICGKAEGTAPIRYSWLKNGVLQYHSTPCLTIDSAQSSADYAMVAANATGSVTSQVATLTVIPSAPVFTQQPLSRGVPPFSTVTLTAIVKGTFPLAMQWYSNGVPVRMQAGPKLWISSVEPFHYADYWLVATNALGAATSQVARLSYSPVVAWGNNDYGQNEVPCTATNVISCVGGDLHWLALRDDGNVVGWGSDTWCCDEYYGQATVPPEATNVIGIAAGSAHSLAVREDGSVVKWGRIIFSDWQDLPAELANVASVAHGSGARHALALRWDGTVVEWGSPYFGLLPVPKQVTNIVSVAAGSYHSLALRPDGTVLSWGQNLSFESPQVVPPEATNVVAIATGWYHNLALRDDGTVAAWGRPVYGSASYTNVPLSATNIVAVACGGSQSLALRRDGRVLSWGSLGNAVPTYATNVVGLAGSQDGMVAILAHGPPRLSVPLLDRSVTSGKTAYFYSPSVGAWPLSYQWRFNGTNLEGATNAWLAVTNVQPGSTGLYSVVVTNNLGMVESRHCALTVQPDQPKIDLPSLSVSQGQFGFTAEGSPGFTWKVDTSSDLNHWTELATITNATGTMTFTTPETTGPKRFYRLRLHQ